MKFLRNIEFDDILVAVYLDPNVPFREDMVRTQSRNPDAFYKGIAWLNKETGEYTDDRGHTIVDRVTARDRELCVKDIYLKEERSDEEITAILNKWLKHTRQCQESTSD